VGGAASLCECRGVSPPDPAPRRGASLTGGVAVRGDHRHRRHGGRDARAASPGANAQGTHVAFVEMPRGCRRSRCSTGCSRRSTAITSTRQSGAIEAIEAEGGGGTSTVSRVLPIASAPVRIMGPTTRSPHRVNVSATQTVRKPPSARPPPERRADDG
jgi:hypothetical protein